jgi:hypothetical protein
MQFCPGFSLPILLLTSSLAVAATPPSVSMGQPPNVTLLPVSLTAIVLPVSDSTDLVVPDAPQPQTAITPVSADSQAASPKQTKRILFVVPNFRSVSADVKLPAMTPKEKFKLVLDDTFDYSSFIEVGILAGVSDWHKSEPVFGHGAVAYGRYYWHGLADTIDGNFMTEFLVPVAAHEDPRYYTLGHGGFIKRTVYSVSRLAITCSDSGNAAPNLAEIVGNGAASGIANFYYPSPERTWTKTGQRWALQVGVDGLSNLVKEFWPDINAKLLHNNF